jgi:hypothetical protein
MFLVHAMYMRTKMGNGRHSRLTFNPKGSVALKNTQIPGTGGTLSFVASRMSQFWETQVFEHYSGSQMSPKRQVFRRNRYLLKNPWLWRSIGRIEQRGAASVIDDAEARGLTTLQMRLPLLSCATRRSRNV